MRVRRCLGLLVLLGASACGGDQPLGDPDADLPELDGKSDVSGLSEALQTRVRDFVQDFTATEGARHFVDAVEALVDLRQQLEAAGIDDPNHAVYVGWLGHYPLLVSDWHHSEFRIRAAVNMYDNRIVHLDRRTVGDTLGSGVFADNSPSPQIGPRMCFTYPELEAAIVASYLQGAYGFNFVCHSVSMRVLKMLGVAPEYFEGKIPGWRISRYAYGPLEDSGLPLDPSKWKATARCGLFPATAKVR